MKKSIIFFLSCLSVLASTAQTIGEAFYIYRNDGQFNAFFRTEIDSIAYSNYDADGNWYEDVVTQRVYTQDSLYQIPLAAIDSVGFVQPETKYKEGVISLESNLLDYIIGADGLTLKLKPNTPSQLVPGNGDKLVLLEGCDALPYGFSGIVSIVQTGSSSIDVVCEQAYLEDLFDSFCSISTVYGISLDEENTTRDISTNGKHRITYSPDDYVFTLGPYKLDRTYEVSQGIAFNGDLALSGGASFSTELQPTFKIHTFLIMGEGQGTYFRYSITGDLEVKTQSSLYGELSYNHDFKHDIVNCPIPQSGYMVNFYITPGLFVRADATIASSTTSMQKYTFGSAFDFSSKGHNTIKPSIGGQLADSSVDMIGSIDGSLAGGAFLEIGFNLLSRDIAKVCVRGEVGGRFSSGFVLRNSDIDNASSETTLYERLKTYNVELSSFANVSLQASVEHTGNGLTWELSEPIHTWNLVPEFSKTKLTQIPNSQISAKAYTELSGDCLFPVNVGYKLFDEDKNEVANYDANATYTNTASYMEHTFAGLDEDKLSDYTVYPKVKVFGFDVLASPEAKMQLNFCPNDNHPHMIDLGLPSGTKWACCNVGATTPEGYGNYYAWGETQPKSVYNWDTYQYVSSSNDMVNIGSDIAGTEYDAATVNWGAPWRMPSFTQIQELRNNCSWDWTTQNGVKGMKFTGPNGDSIFLPAARYRWDSNDYFEGAYGNYWSSSLYVGIPSIAYNLVFYRASMGWGSNYRGSGLSVRPVR